MPTMSCMRAGVQEVFDNPWSMAETPKELERDSIVDKQAGSHNCTEIISTTSVSTKWRALLACRKCKQTLMHYLGKEMLLLIQENPLQYANVCNTGEVAQSVTSNSSQPTVMVKRRRS